MTDSRQLKTEPSSSVAEIETAPPPGRDSKKARQIHDAAARLFLEHGYGVTSMDAVAREAGVSKATLYAHYSSKAQLFAEMIEAECRQRSELLNLSVADPMNPRETLRHFGREFLSIVLSPEGLAIHRIVIAETPRFPELGRAFYDAGPRRMLDALAGYLRSATERGTLDVPEPRMAAGHFISLVRSDMYLRRQLMVDDGGEADDVDRALEAAVTVILRAYAPKGS